MTAIISLGVVVYFKLSNAPIFIRVFYTILMVVQVVAYGGAALKNEGIRSSQIFVDENEYRGNSRLKNL